jgi:hypothetical protein
MGCGKLSRPTMRMISVKMLFGENLKGREHLADLNVNRRVISGRILRKQCVRVCTEFISSKYSPVAGSCKHGRVPSGSKKTFTKSKMFLHNLYHTTNSKDKSSSWEADSSLDGQETPAFYRTRRLVTYSSSPPLVSILSQMNLLHTRISLSLKSRVLSCLLYFRYPKWSLPLRFSN